MPNLGPAATRQRHLGAKLPVMLDYALIAPAVNDQWLRSLPTAAGTFDRRVLGTGLLPRQRPVDLVYCSASSIIHCSVSP